MASVFLSHSRSDKAFARRLTRDLRRAGLIVWIDEAEINVGDSLIEKIREGIDQVDYVVAVVSKNSIGSQWVKRELDVASNKEIEQKRVMVLPALLDDAWSPSLLVPGTRWLQEKLLLQPFSCCPPGEKATQRPWPQNLT